MQEPSFWRGAQFGLFFAYLFLLLNGGYSLLPVKHLYLLVVIILVVNAVVERWHRPTEITTLMADNSRSKPQA